MVRMKRRRVTEINKTSSLPANSELVISMGFPERGPACVKTIVPNWELTAERLVVRADLAHENVDTETIRGMEEYLRMCSHVYPLYVSLLNQTNPLPLDTLEAFLKAHPIAVTDHRSRVMDFAYANPSTRPEVLERLLECNRRFHGRPRARTFEILDCASENDLSMVRNRRSPADVSGIDWKAIEEHLTKHPEEAGIVDVAIPELDTNLRLFPLEAAFFWSSRCHDNVPLSTVRLLLSLCPEALTVPDSAALYLACTCREQDDPEVIRTMLEVKPSLASPDHQPHDTYIGENGPPITEAVRLPSNCAKQIVPHLVKASPESLSAENQLGQIALQVASNLPSLDTDLLRVLLEEGHRHGVGRNVEGGQVFVRGEHGARSCVDSLSSLTENHDSRGRAWDNLCLAWKAAGAFRTGLPVERMWDHPLLHAVIEFDDRGFFDLVLDNFCNDDDLRTKDALGRTPLAVVVEVAARNLGRDDPDPANLLLGLLRISDPSGNFDGNDEDPLGLCRVPLDDRGTLPIHRALHSGAGVRDDGRWFLRALVHAYPQALAAPDPETNLPSMLLVAVGDLASVETTHDLMAERPNLLATLCRDALERRNELSQAT